MRCIGLIILGVFTFSMDTTVSVGAIGLGHSSVAAPRKEFTTSAS